MADLAAEIPAYGALAVAALALVLGEVRQRSTRKARRAAGPLPDTRAALEAARSAFDEIISLGGPPTTFYLDDARREIGRRLRDLANRTGDHSLSVALLEASVAWDNAWAYASPPPPPHVINLAAPVVDTPEERERLRRNDLQADIALEGQDWCQVALDRLNELERNVAQ